MQLSKSEYMMFLKHPAWVWFKKHDKKMLPPVDAATQAIFDAGTAFEQYAEQRFKGGVKLGFDSYNEYESLPKRTEAALAKGAKVIFQGRFEGGGLTSIFDILERVDEETFDLYEIKSSTKVKEEHIDDLAFQTIVLNEAGYKLKEAYVIHVNGFYVRKGDVDPLKLTKLVDVTDEVNAKIKTTKENIAKAKEVINMPKPPDISPRLASALGFRDWLDIYLTIIGAIDDDSIYKLCSLSPELVALLEDKGIKNIGDIPDDFRLNPKQRRQRDAVRSGQQHIDKSKINKFLETIEYPLYFLDYETLSEAAPPFEGMKPYEQLPFQYSLHVLNEPGGELEHYEFLHTSSDSPVPKLVTQLTNDIGQKGTVLVWYEGFEKKCNDLMARLNPEFNDALTAINDRIKDLMIPFTNGWLVDAGFFGSASIKNVLPVLATDLSYKDLDIQEGGSAQKIWMDITLRGVNVPDKEKVHKQLLEYCKLDTLAMVRIYEYLVNIDQKTNDNEQLKLV